MDFTGKSIKAALDEQGYIADDSLCSAVSVALTLGRPLLVEGAAGVGKTEIAKAMSGVLNRGLVRLQCHAGIDETRAVYEWNYQKQLLAIQIHQNLREDEIAPCDESTSDANIMKSIFSEEYLLERPLLESIRSEEPVVLLIDELDKTDEEFEAFLLELLAEYQITIPEIGTVRAETIPFTVLTSNNTRPLSDALRRRCIYAWIDYPSVNKEVAIIKKRRPEADEVLARQVAEAAAKLRNTTRIMKKPSIAEVIDWIAALEALGVERLDRDAAEETISAVLKNRSDAEEALSTPDFP